MEHRKAFNPELRHLLMCRAFHPQVSRARSHEARFSINMPNHKNYSMDTVEYRSIV